MTAIAPASFKTKKALREAVETGNTIYLEDPTPWSSRQITLNHPLSPSGIMVDGQEMPEGYSFTCTNHPRRSWFASITSRPDGSLKVK